MTKNLERKKKEKTKGRTNRRMPICIPTIQFVVVDLYTKYEVSILNGCGDIFDEKVLRKDGRKDGRTEPRTDVNQYTPPHFFKAGVYKYITQFCTPLMTSVKRQNNIVNACDVMLPKSPKGIFSWHISRDLDFVKT